jgi:hypothetical protein
MTPIFEHANGGPILIVQAADALTAATLGFLRHARQSLVGKPATAWKYEARRAKVVRLRNVPESVSTRRCLKVDRLYPG